jgi:class 3 adenylate cyclase
VVELFFVLNIAVPSIVAVSLIRYFARERARVLGDLRAEQERSDRLLFNMLPPTIADRLKTGPNTIADRFEQVTVLFADIVGFTVLTRTTQPDEMVSMLNEIFTTFDALAERHGLEKIKTIGDGYHAVAGIPAPRADHARAAAEMALDMQAALATLREQCGWPLHLRVGMDSGGPVIAGVIGTRKYVYDVWGDTVNAAARMESHGIADGIHLTESAFRALETLYDCAERGTIDVKGIGPMHTYLLRGRLPGATEAHAAA